MKKTVSFLFLSILILLGLIGCASGKVGDESGQLRQLKPNPGNSRVWFYTPAITNLFNGKFRSLPKRNWVEVKVDNIPVGKLGIGTYFYVDVTSGKYEVNVTHTSLFGPKPDTVSVAVGSNQIQFLKIHIRSDGVLTERLMIDAVSENEGQVAIRECIFTGNM